MRAYRSIFAETPREDGIAQLSDGSRRENPPGPASKSLRLLRYWPKAPFAYEEVKGDYFTVRLTAPTVPVMLPEVPVTVTV